MLPENEFQVLMRRVGEGSEDAARQLLDRYGHHVLRVVRRRLHQRIRSRFDSSDFVQDVWVSFFDRPASRSFNGPEALVAFLADIACKRVTAEYRRQMSAQKRTMERERSIASDTAVNNESLLGRDPSPSQVASAKEQFRQLLQGKPDYQQQILEMRHQGSTYREIAGQLGLNTKTVQRVLRRLERPQ